MKTSIGKFDPATRTVPVRFSHAGVTHNRPVNACLTEDGGYDSESTKVRVEEVARGVEHKIASGAITNAPPPPVPEPTAPAE